MNPNKFFLLSLFLLFNSITLAQNKCSGHEDYIKNQQIKKAIKMDAMIRNIEVKYLGDCLYRCVSYVHFNAKDNGFIQSKAFDSGSSIIYKWKGDDFIFVRHDENEDKIVADLLEREKNLKNNQRNNRESKSIELVEQIDSLITSRNFSLAADIFIKNSTNDKLSKFFTPILNGLVETFKKDTVVLSKEVINEFILRNKENLITLNPGNYKFSFNTIGEFSIEKRNYKISLLDQVPIKIVGLTDFNNLKVGGKYMGGIIIKITEKEVLLCTPKPVGSGSYYSALDLCANYKSGGFNWRLPNADELKTIFTLKGKLESYENNWYWTSNSINETAQHIGIQRGDAAYVPKEHGKWVFAVTSISYFKVPLNSEMNISITEKEDLTETKYYSSSKKYIYMQNDSEYYYKSNGDMKSCNYYFDSNIPKNMIRVQRLYQKSKNIYNTKDNLLPIFTKSEQRLDKTDYLILKKSNEKP
jgi:hypothetical protein